MTAEDWGRKEEENGWDAWRWIIRRIELNAGHRTIELVRVSGNLHIATRRNICEARRASEPRQHQEIT